MGADVIQDLGAQLAAQLTALFHAVNQAWIIRHGSTKRAGADVGRLDELANARHQFGVGFLGLFALFAHGALDTDGNFRRCKQKFPSWVPSLP